MKNIKLTKQEQLRQLRIERAILVRKAHDLDVRLQELTE